jgi:hypothetical protein
MRLQRCDGCARRCGGGGLQVATELTEVAKIDNRTSKQFNFHKW